MANGPEKPPIQPLRPEHWPKPGVSDEHLRLVGRVAVSWGWLEAAMQDVLWSLLGVKIEDGRVVTQRTDAARKILWMRTFASKHLEGDDLTEMRVILKDIALLQGDRNFIIHGSWGTLMPEDVPIAASVREKSDKSDEVVSETFDKDRMEDIIIRTDKAKMKLIAWRNRLEASRETPPQPQPRG